MLEQGLARTCCIGVPAIKQLIRGLRTLGPEKEEAGLERALLCQRAAEVIQTTS